MREEGRVTKTIRLKDATLICKNFQGRRTDFNKEGERNFGVLIDHNVAEALKEDGWNVKYLKPRSPEEESQPWLPVKVKFGDRPPLVELNSEDGKVFLDEESIGQLDWTLIKNCKVVIRPYNYSSFKGRPAGVSAYLKALQATIDEEDFSHVYGDIG